MKNTKVNTEPRKSAALEINSSSKIHFVLVNTTHAGNIGAAARAMKTMGFESLRLVEPCSYLTQEAHVRASGAGETLENATTFLNLAAALSDCTSVFGTSARSRSLEGGIQTAREAATRIAGKLVADNVAMPGGSDIAIVFGRERSGLSNEELALCDQRLWIPCNPGFSSLNLGSAVQVVAYELRQAMLIMSQTGRPVERRSADNRTVAGDNFANGESLERFYQHLEQTLVELEFLDPDNPRLLMRRLRRYFMRNRPDVSELNILRGILSAAGKAALKRDA